MSISLTGTLCAPTAGAVHLVEEAFLHAHAYVVNARQLGGLALVFQWEMDHDHRADLERALRAIDLHLDQHSLEVLRAPREAGPVEGFLHVNLQHEGPDERVPVPEVPG